MEGLDQGEVSVSAYPDFTHPQRPYRIRGCSMKKIEAIIRPTKLDDVKEASRPSASRA